MKKKVTTKTVKKKVAKKIVPKKIKIDFPENCPHKPFFGCNKKSECLGCYYNPNQKIAMMKRDIDDPTKSPKDDWFYGSKRHAKKCLEMLEDIKLGRGLHKGGTRCYFKYARKSGDEEVT